MHNMTGTQRWCTHTYQQTNIKCNTYALSYTGRLQSEQHTDINNNYGTTNYKYLETHRDTMMNETVLENITQNTITILLFLFSHTSSIGYYSDYFKTAIFH